MPVDVVSSPFRTRFAYLDGCNLLDPIFGRVGWTAGATIIDTIPIDPSLAVRWMIYGWSIRYAGFWVDSLETGDQQSGKIGKLFGGLVMGAQQTRQFIITGEYPFTDNCQLPTNLSLLDVMWDGQADDLFPYYNARTINNVALPPDREHVMQLPQPIEVRSGSQISAGMWLTPTLTNQASFRLGIRDAVWTIMYEELPL